MQIRRVHAVYFSGTGTTEKTVRRIAAQAAQQLGAELSAIDFTPPQARQQRLTGRPDARGRQHQHREQQCTKFFLFSRHSSASLSPVRLPPARGERIQYTENSFKKKHGGPLRFL